MRPQLGRLDDSSSDFLSRQLALRSVASVMLVLVFGLGVAAAQGNDDCFMCHEDPDLVGDRDGQEITVYVDPESFGASIHSDFECIDCHADLDGVELPHEEQLDTVDCAMCHDDVAESLAAGPHGKWAPEKGSPSAACARCHGIHDVLPASDPNSRIFPAKANEMCSSCHGREERQVERSPHAEVGPSGRPNATCVDCHRGHEVDAPDEPLAQLESCGVCHEQEATGHRRSLHGQAAVEGDPLAPSCVTCHEHHEIRPNTDLSAPTAVTNIPLLCGRCHREGSEVSLQHDIPQERILENFSMSVHGEGLFKKGLTVTAVCTSCHTSHDILDHEHSDSSINRGNVADTCMQCHSRIEEVHIKVVEGHLWEEEPHKVPSCVECHEPHKIRRRPVTAEGAGTRNCMICHGDEDLKMVKDGEEISLYVDAEAYAVSSHFNTACAQCHTEVTPRHPERACATIENPVDCSSCHAEQVQQHRESTHGLLAAEGDPDAPSCLDCHDDHATMSQRMPTSPTYPRNVPELCAKCHRQGEPAAGRIDSEIPDIVQSYVMSIHGKGLLESGLVVSATCTDCHTAHHPQSADHEDSTIHSDNIAETCGTCHHGIEEIFRTSVHWPGNTETDRDLPTCEACHTSHTIGRTDAEGFRMTMMNQCGRCHEEEANTFFDTYHGKVSRLGSEGAAKCYDCHGTHNILPTTDPDSMLSHDNVVETCASCHPGAHRKFAGYLTHATHHDPDKYPYLFYAFWFMTSLLVGTLTFAILHTLAWLWRLWRTKDKWIHHKSGNKEQRFYVRFSRSQRISHAIMLLSFFTLALTGMTLKFSFMGWASVLSRLMGGFASMALLHRIGAVVLVGIFVFHLTRVYIYRAKSGESWFRYIFGENSMMFNLNDIKQVYQSIKWFLGMGERPNYGRFTYWEKFDYFAVFWGVFIIGGTGLILWFPVFFTRILPGWSVNVATIVHSDEALLAVGFIFTIHFFNTHFRPDKFPMDPVIFTGRVSLEELKHDKPREYELAVKGKSIKEIDAMLVDPVRPVVARIVRWVGMTALTIGLTLIALIVYAMIFGYR